jgi:hypothetical protein
MVKFLHHRCLQSKWLEPQDDTISTTSLGVMLRRPGGDYTAEPMMLSPPLVQAVDDLGAAVAFTMSSEITRALLQQITPFQTELSLDPRGFVLPIINSVKDLGSVKKERYICLCKEEKMVLVWGDSAEGILAHGTDIETRLLGLVCPPNPSSRTLDH